MRTRNLILAAFAAGGIVTGAASAMFIALMNKAGTAAGETMAAAFTLGGLVN